MKERQTTSSPAKIFDEYHDRYANEVNNSIGFTGVKLDYINKCKANYIEDEARRHFGETDQLSILDIGCGVGAIHPRLSNKFDTITGIDISTECIKQAREVNPGVHYLSYQSNQIPFEDNSFDITLAMCVMHHVTPSEWDAFLLEAYRVTKPNGMILVFEHNPLNPLTRHAVNHCPFDADAVLLNPGTIMGLAQASGFRKIHRQYIFTIPCASSIARKLDKFLGLLHLGGQYFVKAVK
jgi:2-polyprenyl-3-methyl-5-hydroxy-6-metoxy-1,4-benzoquinol methylase